jgi:hypothetical protein
MAHVDRWSSRNFAFQRYQANIGFHALGSFCPLSTTMRTPPRDVLDRLTRSTSMNAEMKTGGKQKGAGGKEDNVGPMPRGTL